MHAAERTSSLESAQSLQTVVDMVEDTDAPMSLKMQFKACLTTKNYILALFSNSFQIVFYYILVTIMGQIIQPYGLTGTSLIEGLGIILNLFGILGGALASFIYKGGDVVDFRKAILGSSFVSLIALLYFLIVAEAYQNAEDRDS